MKRLIFLAISALLSMGIMVLLSCSNPLEVYDPAELEPPAPIVIYDTVYSADTVYVVDTLYDSDTTIIIDTIYGSDTTIVIDTVVVIDTMVVFDTTTLIDTNFVVDTIIVTDTVIYVDTVIIYEPGDGQPQTVCSIILANLNEIIWMFRNQAGDYNLTFEATAARDFTFRTLTVEVDGQQFTWNPSDNPVFDLQLYVNANATIRVFPDQPVLAGHEITICLTIAKPE